MVRYHGRAKQRIGAVNTNQLGLKMSGCPSRVGRSGKNIRLLGQRVNCMQGICAPVLVHGVPWRQTYRNAHPFCHHHRPSTKDGIYFFAGSGFSETKSLYTIGNGGKSVWRNSADGNQECDAAKGACDKCDYCDATIEYRFINNKNKVLNGNGKPGGRFISKDVWEKAPLSAEYDTTVTWIGAISPLTCRLGNLTFKSKAMSVPSRPYSGFQTDDGKQLNQCTPSPNPMTNVDNALELSNVSKNCLLLVGGSPTCCRLSSNPGKCADDHAKVPLGKICILSDGSCGGGTGPSNCQSLYELGLIGDPSNVGNLADVSVTIDDIVKDPAGSLTGINKLGFGLDSIMELQKESGTDNSADLEHLGTIFTMGPNNSAKLDRSKMKTFYEIGINNINALMNALKKYAAIAGAGGIIPPFPYWSQLNSTNLPVGDFLKGLACDENPCDGGGDDKPCCTWNGGFPQKGGKCSPNGTQSVKKNCSYTPTDDEGGLVEMSIFNLPFFALSADMIDTKEKTTQKVYFTGIDIPEDIDFQKMLPIIEQFFPISLQSDFKSSFGVITTTSELNIDALIKCISLQARARQACFNAFLDKNKPRIEKNTQYKFTNFKYESPDLFNLLCAFVLVEISNNQSDGGSGEPCSGVKLFDIDKPVGKRGDGCWGPWVMK